MRFSKVKHLIFLSIFFVLFVLDVSAAENCKRYRAKTKNVPVYSKPDATALRLKPLSEGEEVCYIGEINEFAIIDLRGFEKVDAPISEESTAYVRLFDLWEPVREQRKLSQRDQVREFFDFWRHGGIPDDPVAPFRFLWGGQGPEMKCEAGKICEKVNKKLEKGKD